MGKQGFGAACVKANQKHLQEKGSQPGVSTMNNLRQLINIPPGTGRMIGNIAKVVVGTGLVAYAGYESVFTGSSSPFLPAECHSGR